MSLDSIVESRPRQQWADNLRVIVIAGVLFALGVLGAEAGWLGEFPPVLARRLGWVAAAGLAALVALMVPDW